MSVSQEWFHGSSPDELRAFLLPAEVRESTWLRPEGSGPIRRDERHRCSGATSSMICTFFWLLLKELSGKLKHLP
jgi:hypothetical protein